MSEITFDEITKRTIRGIIVSEMKEQMRTGFFTERKLTDTPTDNLQVVNRKYVTANGATGNRPGSPVVGQFYFDTTLGIPIWYEGPTWVNASGTPV